MKLFEHEAKNILAKYKIPIPQGGLATTPAQAKEIALRLKPPYAVKAQVLVAGRGKAGGIQFASTPEEAEIVASKILGMTIKGIKVRSVWVEEKINVKKELYFGITTDRSQRCYVAIATSAGGMDIEEVATKTPEKIAKHFIDPALGFRTYNARDLAKKIGYTSGQMQELTEIFMRFYIAAMDYDAELMEMNPLVETTEGKFVAADARLIIDDNALFRHPDYKTRVAGEGETELTPQEIKAQKADLAYVKLDGNIGIIGNGAGLVMATLDAIQLYGGRPANFLDAGGGASPEQMATALDIVLSDPNVSVVFINILGGITRCDDVARGILEAKKRVGFTKPIVIRLVGTNEEEGRRLLTAEGIHVLDSMENAAKKAVEITKTKEP
ncbi:MAG: ADP-forming succinate--CoA ligase subunit beta [Candidatus Bathyarchaeia archaeon]|jgi:succinyl-CoA synthetase beta subunit|nr:ADP-forming succinate--CoA ligase subunit beta [Candidatus Bathyarchaeota archaeon A05DMB-4]MDH7594917.1 ADP-forming succinate--CoA ligase subunit beta [Candidatus Bathyarchaeota archaeon]